jgi:hypothetical protein
VVDVRVSVSPERLEVVPGLEQKLTISLTNPGTVIAGYTVRVLGADPSWVELEEARVSLFPDETRDLTATVTVPAGLAAGERRMAVQVRELTPPERSVVEELVLVVPEAPNTKVRLDPLSLSIGRSGRFSLLIENAGNTAVTGWLAADDSESKVRTRFEPRQVELAPGEHLVADMRVKGKRPFIGAPAVRQLNVHLVEGQPMAGTPTGPSLEAPGRKRSDPFAPPDPEAQPAAVATVLQKALLSRGPIGLLGLLAAITVFAIVITLALSRIVGQSAQDRNLALQIAAAREQAQTGGSSGLSGTVRELTSGRPVKGVAVDVFNADDLVDPVASLATGANGSYRVNGLNAGDYKIAYRGAGFEPLWYPSALDAENAEVVKVEDRNRVAGLDVNLGGAPASIAGLVNGDDVADASVSLRIPAPTIAPDPTSPGGQVGVGAIGDPDDDGAIVDTVPVGTDGRFSFAGVPSPSEYDVVVTKEGYATAVQRVDVSAGETRKGVELNLRKGDGLVNGTVVSEGNPLEGVTLTATSGESSVSSVSLKDGSFTLRQLPTPATYTLVATLDGYASQAVSLTLGEAQKLTGVAISMGASSGSLNGRTTLVDGQKLGGVTVSVTDGSQIVQTATQSSPGRNGDIGDWEVSGLALPGTYTITFSRDDLAATTVSVSLDAAGRLTDQSIGATVTSNGIQTVMQSATGSLSGTISQEGVGKVGEVTVSLTSGESSFSVVTASVPTGQKGEYHIEKVPPGTYTVSVSRSGVRPTSSIIEIVAGVDTDYTVELDRAAGLSGLVRTENGATVGRGYVVQLFRAVDYPNVAYRTTTTNDSGRYTFDDVDAPEAYVVQVRRTRGGVPLGTTTVEIGPSDTPSNVNVRVSDD